MSLPASYSEATAKALMHDALGPVATALGWSVDGGSYDEAVNDLLMLADATDIAALAVGKVRLLAQVAVWRRVAAHTAGNFNYSADGSTFNRAEIHKHAVAMVLSAESAAQADGYLSSYAIDTGSITYTNDPYHESDTDTEWA